MSLPKDLERFSSLVDIIAYLRGPEGCPWDREQTHRSLREGLLEECYEVLEALDEADSGRLCVELGDLLMQIVFHTQVAEEAGEFELADVIRGINAKLIRRHPHVFGDVEAGDADQVLASWEAIKKKERDEDASMLASVPPDMPALAYSQEVQARVARVGFDWDEDEGVLEKLTEEVRELGQVESREEMEAEYGDILFTLANIARRQGIDLEAALRRGNRRFYGRFAAMEETCRKRGLNFEKLSFEQQNKLWEEVKGKVG
ncbi:MAG: nucleoside triphosphate pyrophosphohydrolase [Dehalococcoidales bacterium]